MTLRSPRFALVLLGDRLVAAAVQGSKLETFSINAEQPSTTLRAELDQRRLSVRTVALGLPRAAVTVKPIELPDVDGALRDMVQFELERHLPFPSDDASFDFVPIANEAESAAAGVTARRVLIVAAERRVVDGTLRLLEGTRLRPVSLTVAAHDLVALVPSRPRGHIVWAHRVGGVTSLIFLASGQIVLSRSLSTTEEDAIAAEIQRSLAVARWHKVDAIWRSGDGPAPASPSSSALSSFGAPVAAPAYTREARALLGQITEPEPGATQLAVAAAIAAGRRVHPLQLLPLALQPRRLTRQQLAAMGALAAAIVLGITALLVPGYREARQLAAIDKRIAALDGQVRAVEGTLQDLERKRRLLALIRSVETTSIRPLMVLRELTDLLPADAWLTTVAFDPKGVELTGQAGSASALIPVLENSPSLERVEFASPVTRGRDKEMFRIRAAWEGAVAPPADNPPPSRDGRPRPGAAGSPPPPDAGARRSEARPGSRQ